MLRRALSKGDKPRVCVIGAGIAGLRCAQLLAEGGLDVTVMEARDRVGGRMHQSKLGGHLVDLGPNWIHGLKENPIFNLAKELDESLFDVPEVVPSVYDQTGHLLGKEDGRQQSEIMWGIIEEAFKYSDKESASIPQDQSLLDFFKLKLKEKQVPDATAERVLQACRSWGDYVGGAIDRQSLKYFWLEETIDGGNMFLAGTYKAILDRISNDTLPKTSLHLSTKVTSIASQATGNDQYPTLPITVTTSDHESLGFDEVVMTAPLGYLKRNIDAFQPPLSPRLLTAIHNISYGALEKVYLTFPTAFWLCAKDQGTEQPFHNLWLAPDFTPHHYPVECVSLSSLPVPHAHPTLLFYMHGPLATHITSITSSLEPSAPEYLTILADFFRPYYSLLPFYSPTSHHCGPTHALATNWQNDEFAGYGSYSNFQISDPEKDGMVALDKDIEALREGMPERRLWLAGEHVAPFVALGTVTGAWLSGEKVARRILGEYGVHEKGFVGDMADVDVEEGKVASKRGGTAVGA